MKRTLLCLLWLAIIMISFPYLLDQLSASDGKVQSTRLVITGILVDSNGSPRSNEEVWAFGSRLGRIEVGDKGRVLNPTAKTDEKGQFRLEFDQNLFGTEDIIIGITYTPRLGGISSFAGLQNDKGIPVSLKIELGVTNLSLGKIKVSTK